MADAPGYDQLVAELGLVRRRGLIRSRRLDLPGLAAICSLIEPAQPPGALDRMLRQAIAGLQGTLAVAAEYTFGLADGTRDWPVGDRRRRAAQLYGVSTERFRKHHEPMIVTELAGRLIELAAVRSATASGTGPRVLRVTARLGGALRPVAVHAMPVELVRDIDILVAPINTHLELPQRYKSSVSASLRRAGAVTGPAGELRDDVIQRELTEWARAHGAHGLSVPPGTVAVTGPGRLSASGVRRIYHAAVATPRVGLEAYDVSPGTIARAIRNVFACAETENLQTDPPLRSVCLPLLGAGRGGLDRTTSLTWMCAALDRVLTGPADPWELAFVARSAQGVQTIVDGLATRR